MAKTLGFDLDRCDLDIIMLHGSPEIVTIQKNDLDIPLHFFGSQNMGECETNLKIMIQ